jgi:hypothetical protein
MGTELHSLERAESLRKRSLFCWSDQGAARINCASRFLVRSIGFTPTDVAVENSSSENSLKIRRARMSYKRFPRSR